MTVARSTTRRGSISSISRLLNHSVFLERQKKHVYNIYASSVSHVLKAHPPAASRVRCAGCSLRPAWVRPRYCSHVPPSPVAFLDSCASRSLPLLLASTAAPMPSIWQRNFQPPSTILSLEERYSPLSSPYSMSISLISRMRRQPGT